MVGSEFGQKQSKIPAEYGLQHNSPPPSQTHTLSVYTVYLVWEVGGGGGQREDRGASISIVFSSMGATVNKRGRKYQPMS